MRSALRPLETGYVDPDRNRMQLSFGIDQVFQTGISKMLGEVIPKRHHAAIEQQAKLSVVSEDHVTQNMILSEVVDSPVEMKPFPSPEKLASPSKLTSDNVSKSSKPTYRTRPGLQRRQTSMYTRSDSLASTAAGSFWYFLPICLAISALVFDLPLLMDLQSFSIQLALPTDSSLMLSLTVCGMLLFWLCGCAVLLILAFFMLGMLDM